MKAHSFSYSLPSPPSTHDWLVAGLEIVVNLRVGVMKRVQAQSVILVHAKSECSGRIKQRHRDRDFCRSPFCEIQRNKTQKARKEGLKAEKNRAS